jgi:hypothetical protein
MLAVEEAASLQYAVDRPHRRRQSRQGLQGRTGRQGRQRLGQSASGASGEHCLSNCDGAILAQSTLAPEAHAPGEYIIFHALRCAPGGGLRPVRPIRPVHRVQPQLTRMLGPAPDGVQAYVEPACDRTQTLTRANGSDHLAPVRLTDKPFLPIRSLLYSVWHYVTERKLLALR